MQYLAKELPRHHKNAFHTVTREQFAAAVAKLDASIPSLQAHEILVGMQRIVALVGDAHTELNYPQQGNFKRYPLSLYWSGNELRVTRTTSTYRRALGARVVRIGELDLSEAAARIDQLVPRENDQWVRARSVEYFPIAEVLHALKILPQTDHGQWTFEDAARLQFSLDLVSIPPDEKVEWLSTLKDVPLYRQRLNEPFWFTSLADSKTVYLNFKGYPDSGTFKRLTEELLALFDSTKARRLVLDVRRNSGGDVNKVRAMLLPALKQRTIFRQPRSLYVIIGRATQSAAMINAIDLRRELQAVLVGEPSGGSPNSYSENDEFKLPHSHLKISYSTRYYKFQEQDTPALGVVSEPHL